MINIDATLEAFISRIIRNKEIMDILNLPTISKEDNKITIDKKRNLLIDKAITKTAQVPEELGKEFKEIEINNVKYKDYGDTRITVSLVQSIKMNSYIFGNPQVEINIYYDNTRMKNVFKLVDLIFNEFSGQDLKLELKDNKQLIRNLKCEGNTSQVAIINNYERVGIRFSFYATLYKN